MNATEAAFLKAIEDEPGETVHVLVYADWLEDQGRALDSEGVRAAIGAEVKAVEDLRGKVLLSATSDADEVNFTLADGRRFHLHHNQDCCENVYVEDVCGDLADLVGSPLTVAEEVSNYQGPERGDESYTWTFYRFATSKGFVTVRFLGSSNGYYSERVDFGPVGGHA